MKINIRNLVLVLIVVMLASFGLASALGGRILPLGDAGFSIGLEDIDETFEFTAAEIKEIEINTISTDVNIIPVDDSVVKVHLYGEVTKDILPDEFAHQNGSRLKIEVRPRTGLNINARIRLTLDIYTPKTYAESIRVDTVSGELDIAELTLKQLEFNSVSGDIESDAVEAEQLVIKTTSGNMNIDDFSGMISANSVSGDLTVEYREYAHDIEFNTTSGRTELSLPATAQFEVRLQSVSGKVNSEFPITINSSSSRDFAGIVGSNEHSIDVRSVSGGIDIKKQ
ncbi:MAG: DUF4097 domain-containing protein [Firmicutes bacterium]|nr:DUF4097 domain-containing protein [Bacillota bacterium]